MTKSKTSGHRPAGGIRSRNKVEIGYRAGKPKERVRPSGVAQIGQRQGNHVTEQGSTPYGGISPFGAGKGFPSELGNTLAAKTQCGPGGSREVMRSGAQGVHGEVNRGEPMPRPKEIWPGFGK